MPTSNERFNPTETRVRIQHALAPDTPRIFRNAAKLHPELKAGPGIQVITYGENTDDFWELFRYDFVYRPRFLRLEARR